MDQLDYIVIPIHLTNHWVLAIFKMKAKKAYYLDSLGSKDKSRLLLIGNYINSLQNEKTIFDFSCVNINIQKNNSDCGIYVLMNALLEIEYQSDYVFQERDISQFRHFVYGMIMDEGRN